MSDELSGSVSGEMNLDELLKPGFAPAAPMNPEPQALQALRQAENELRGAGGEPVLETVDPIGRPPWQEGPGDDEDGESVAEQPTDGDGWGGPSQPSRWSRDDVVESITALKRDGIPDNVIRHWVQNDPDSLVARGLEASSRISERDDDFRRSREGSRTSGTAEPTEGPLFALPESVKQALKGSPTAAADLEQALSDQLSKLSGRMDLIGNTADVSGIEAARAGLVSLFPQLADERNFDRVKFRMRELVSSEGKAKFRSYSGLMRRAVEEEFGKANSLQRRQRLNQARQSGQPTSVGTRTRANGQKHTEGDVLDWALREIQKGRNPASLRNDVERMQKTAERSTMQQMPPHLRFSTL